MALNLIFALAILIAVLRTRKARDFASYPTMLLLSILFGLAVNIAAVRLILSKGPDFDCRLILAVSSLFTGSGNIRLGICLGIFFVILGIQMIITAKGAARVAEVAARFALDSGPAKMTTIEAEYNSGAITEDEAAARKNAVQRESDFLCSMDGAAKFITGNDKVKLIVIGVSIIGGILIGTLLRAETISDALRTYVSLSIANGFFFMVHGFLLSFAMHHAISYNFTDGKISKITPDPLDKEMSKIIPNPLSIELGYGLISLVEKEKGEKLSELIVNLRRQVALDPGLVLPKIRIIDNMLLEPSEYCILIKGVEMGRGRIKKAENVDGVTVNCAMYDAGMTIIKHLEEIVKNHANEFAE
jgi:flagellar biosynthesis protein FlhA